MKNILATAPMHRWIGGVTPDLFKKEAYLYQPKPGFVYQTDYTYNEHFSILDAEGAESLVRQVEEGARITPVCFHHFTDKHCEAVQLLLENGQIDYRFRQSIQHLIFAAYNHLNHYGNREIAMAILVCLIGHSLTKSELLFELEYYHGYEGVCPEYLKDFTAFLDGAIIATNAMALEMTLPRKGSSTEQQKVKI